MTAPPYTHSHPSKSGASLEVPWHLATAMPQEHQPLRVGIRLAVSFRNIHHLASVLKAQALLLLAVISICFDIRAALLSL